MGRDLRKLKIKKVPGRVAKGETFFKVGGLRFASKSDANAFKRKLEKQELEERKRMLRRRR